MTPNLINYPLALLKMHFPQTILFAVNTRVLKT